MDDIPVKSSKEVGNNQSKGQLVKSNAVVKYSAVNTPASFARLQFNTDLKTPPSNWISSNGDLYGLNHVLYHSSGFSSFRMAHMFLDCVGEVDVVSDAENIKKLLKIPYSSSPVSMLVHRIENTLLIDDFDINKHLLSRSESEWPWLRKFFYEDVRQTLGNKALFYKNHTRNALQQKSLVSKFLHHSLAESQEKDVVSPSYKNPLPLTMRGPALPEPKLEEGLPDAMSNHKFARNVVWTFEDIQMLLGTDMPIFGGSTRPCISLRLGDATKPISVLTGIDYWLDNLMSNVPEVVMCYHLDGIVQKYELIKTEDLPQLPESKFSPKLIRDVAQNILSFLKSNATKAGHTYWLFKGKNEDAVKLYDLTSLCSDSLEEKDQNPFTVPVGLLLYRVARNMRASPESSKELKVIQMATIRMLLKNCLKLLIKEKNPEIVLSAHYMLSDIYIPCETDPCHPLLEDIPSPAEQSEEEEVCASNSVPVTSLCVANYKSSSEHKYHPPPVVGSIEDRCKSSLKHVLEGLDCLQYFKVGAEKNEGQPKEEPKMANPSEPIPMPFPEENASETEKRKKKKKDKKSKDPVNTEHEEQDNSLKALLCRPTAETLPKWQKPEKVDSESWKKHLTSLLCTKACLVYSILVEKEIEAGRFVLALKHIRGVLRCSSENNALAGLMLLKAGDCLFSLCREKLFDEADSYPQVLRPLPIPHENELNLIPNEYETLFSIISSCIACYKRSNELCPNSDILKRLGNAYNELGNSYNDHAAEMVRTDEHLTENTKFLYLISEAERLLKGGLEVLESINDSTNTALVVCNIGRLWRLKAHAGHSLSAPLNVNQKHFYRKAVASYNKALKIIGTRKNLPSVWDLITWELSTTLYLMATRCEETPLVEDEDAERESIDLLNLALQHCDLVNDTPKLPLYQYRAASLNHKMASICHKSLRNYPHGDPKKKSKRLLCNIYYGKAFELFSLINSSTELIRIQLERISLSELMAKECKSTHKKIEHFEEAISHFKDCWKAFVIYEETMKNKVDEKSSTGNSYEDIAEEEVGLIREKINDIIKTLIKLYISIKSSEKAEKYKNVFRVLLRRDESVSSTSHLIKVIQSLNEDDEA